MTVIQKIQEKGYATSQELERLFPRDSLVKAISLHIGFGDIKIDSFKMESGRYNAKYVIV
jgi:hypothetical protein